MGVNDEVVVMGNVWGFLKKVVGREIWGDKEEGIVGREVERVIIGRKVVWNGMDKEGVVEMGKVGDGRVENGDIVDVVGMGIVVEEDEGGVGVVEVGEVLEGFEVVVG